MRPGWERRQEVTPEQSSAVGPPRLFLRLLQRLPGSQACLRLQLRREPRPPPPQPAEPVSSGAPAACAPPHRGFQARRFPPPAPPRASPQPAAASGQAPGAEPWPGISTASSSPVLARLLQCKAQSGRVALAASSPSAAPPLHPMAFKGGEWGASPAGEEPLLGWGVCALHHGARLTCPLERAPGRVCARVCVCGSVCTRLRGLE